MGPECYFSVGEVILRNLLLMILEIRGWLLVRGISYTGLALLHWNILKNRLYRILESPVLV